MAVLNIKSADFQEIISKSEKPLLIDFWASWCGPCKMLSPVIDLFAEEHPEIQVAKVNVDDEAELTKTFRICSVPTLVVFQNGVESKRAVGVLSEEEILDLF